MTDMVGLVGVGAMGSALLARLRNAGKRVQAFDISDTGRQAAQQGGATLAASAAAAAKGARYTHVFVRSDRDVIDAVLGPDGTLAGADAGSVIFLHSTILPTTTRQVADAAAQRQVQIVDAPITAVPAKVLAGEATFLVGGPEDLIKTVRPHLEALGKAVHHFGPLGTGNVAKLVKNLTNGTERVMIAQALMLAEAGGIDPRQMIALMQAEDHGSIVHNWEKAFTVTNGHVGLKGGANIFSKDLPLAAELAKRYQLDLGVIRDAATAGMRYTGVEQFDPLPPAAKRA
jgi:3-hydroxyisobutyrate dehydrogenase-like beta-hydroxyacid dehydrogenase